MTDHAAISVVPYHADFQNQIVELILHIQNVEANVGISAEDQPDILSIPESYLADRGGFWVALDGERHVVGTIGLQRKDAAIGILKKFFVAAEYRGVSEGAAAKLYSTLIDFASSEKMRTILLDTPSVATRSHAFYKRAGFRQIEKSDLPVTYDYPDRNSLLFRLDLA